MGCRGHYVTWCAIMSSSTRLTLMWCWPSMKPGFLSRARRRAGSRGNTRVRRAKVTNPQIGVFVIYVSRHGHAFIDRALYLPRSWTDDPTRLKATYVPSTVAFGQAATCICDDRARDCRRSSLPMGDQRHGLWCRRYRAGSAPSRQGICAWCRRLACFGPGASRGSSPAPLRRLLKL